MAKGSDHVLMGSRSLEKGNAALKELQSRDLPGSVEMLQIDVTNDDTIECAAASIIMEFKCSIYSDEKTAIIREYQVIRNTESPSYAA